MNFLPSALLAALVFCLPGLGLAQNTPEPDDYRMDHYRALVPDGLVGAVTVDPEAAHALWLAKAAFVDVFPRAPKPANLPEGTIWRQKPRLSIPGAIWLPNVGYGAIADVTAEYFQTGLTKVTEGDLSKPVVFFCLEECWMSWNAAKRAIEWGHLQVYWFPEGTDGWNFWDYPVEEVKPEEPQP